MTHQRGQVFRLVLIRELDHHLRRRWHWLSCRPGWRSRHRDFIDPSFPSRDRWAGAAGSAAGGAAAAGSGAPEDVGDGDAVAYSGGDAVLLDAAAMADCPGDCASSRRGTLWGCLRLVVFFLIFAAVLGDGGCKFNTSGPD